MYVGKRYISHQPTASHALTDYMKIAYVHCISDSRDIYALAWLRRGFEAVRQLMTRNMKNDFL